MGSPRATAAPTSTGTAAKEAVSSATTSTQPTPGPVMFEVRPLRHMDLPHVPAIRCVSYWDALVAAGRMSEFGCPCIVWTRRAAA